MANVESFGQIPAERGPLKTVDLLTASVALRIDLDPRMEVEEDEAIDHVVIEDFTLRPAHRVIQSDMETIKLVGMLEWAFHRIGFSESIGNLTKQSASSAKGVITDARLQQWGYWLPHKQRHARDAIRHALLYERKRGQG